MKALAELSDEELLQEFEKRKKKAHREAQAKKKKYEEDRNALVVDACLAAESLHEMLAKMKTDSFTYLDEFMERMREYSDVNGKSKGGFSLVSKDGKSKLTLSFQTKKTFDERADMAEEKLKKFLESFVKARDKKAYKLIMSLLERTRGGDFDDNLIMKLWSMENDFDNDDWRDSIRLFKESYNPAKTTKYINFYKKDGTDKWQNIQLNFSSISV
ncbi:MAG: DUF3164 family protein [Fulvivirga sp.]